MMSGAVQALEVTDTGHYWHIVFMKGSEEAVDEWLKQVTRIQCTAKATDYFAYLIEYRPHAKPPLRVAINRAREFAARTGVKPSTKTAIIVNAGEVSLLSALNLLLGWLQAYRRDKARFFPHSQRDDAIAWLMTEG